MAFEGLPRDRRIRSSKDFAAMRLLGRSLHTKHLKVVLAPTRARNAVRNRLGLVVSKRVSKRAVDRNRVKRMLREVFRRDNILFPASVDILLIAKPRSLGCNTHVLSEELRGASSAINKLHTTMKAQMS